MSMFVNVDVQAFFIQLSLVRMCVEGYLQHRNRHMMECVLLVFEEGRRRIELK